MRIFVLLLIGAIPFALTACKDQEPEGDVTFAKETFESLARGDSDVAEKINWETFSALGIPVGQQYLAIGSDEEKREFTKSFVFQFSTNFRESGGSVENFTDWRVLSHGDNQTQVAADSRKGLLKITVSERNGKERLTSFDIEK